jgi:hypothetical protein
MANLLEIADYIIGQSRNIVTAQSYLDRIYDRCKTIGDTPLEASHATISEQESELRFLKGAWLSSMSSKTKQSASPMFLPAAEITQRYLDRPLHLNDN